MKSKYIKFCTQDGGGPFDDFHYTKKKECQISTD